MNGKLSSEMGEYIADPETVIHEQGTCCTHLSHLPLHNKVHFGATVLEGSPAIAGVLNQARYEGRCDVEGEVAHNLDGRRRCMCVRGSVCVCVCIRVCTCRETPGLERVVGEGEWVLPTILAVGVAVCMGECVGGRGE